MYKIEDLQKIPVLSDIIHNHKKYIKQKGIDLVIRQIVREIINAMVKDIILNTENNIKQRKIKSISDVLKCDKKIVYFSDTMNLFDLNIKSFLKEKMYFSKDVYKNTNKGKKIIKFLFDKIRKKPKKFINKNMQNSNHVERSISDYIAGMTDRYAINLYNSLK